MLEILLLIKKVLFLLICKFALHVIFVMQVVPFQIDYWIVSHNNFNIQQRPIGKHQAHSKSNAFGVPLKCFVTFSSFFYTCFEKRMKNDRKQKQSIDVRNSFFRILKCHKFLCLLFCHQTVRFFSFFCFKTPTIFKRLRNGFKSVKNTAVVDFFGPN